MTTAPTEFEQMMLELTNRARSDPSGELDFLILQDDPAIGAESGITNALRFFEVDIALLRSQLEGVAAVAPLAWNENLATSADAHSQLMIDFDEQSHNLPGELGLGDRIRAAGYEFRRAAENIFAFTESPVQGHAGFYIDWGFGPGGIQDPAGHRLAILNPNFTEVGMGILEQPDPNADTGPFVVTQHFGQRFGTNIFLTGVVIDDINDDDFYGFGEGLGGVTVEAVGINGTTGTFSTVTYETGGYNLAISNGTYDVTFSGGDFVGEVTKTVTINGENVKLDAELDDVVPLADPGTGTPDIVVYPDGSQLRVIYDLDEVESWATVEEYRDPSGALYDKRFNYDDGMQQRLLFDTGDSFVWTSVQEFRDAASALYDKRFNYDDGTQQRLAFDTQDLLIWTSVQEFRDASNALYAKRFNYDDGTQQRLTFDMEANAWDTLIEFRDVDGALYDKRTVYDDGSANRLVIDVDGAQSWDTIQELRNEAGALFKKTTYYDGGGYQLTLFDVDGTESWDTYARLFDDEGNLLSSSFV